MYWALGTTPDADLKIVFFMRSCQRVAVTQRLDIVIKKAVDAIRLLKSASMSMQFAAALRDPELHKRLDRDEFFGK